MDNSTILLKAADYIEQYGWYQYDYGNDHTVDKPACCPMGAIASVMFGKCPTETPEDPAFESVLDDLCEYLFEFEDRYMGYPVDLISTWNDAKDQTKSVVVDTLRKAGAID